MKVTLLGGSGLLGAAVRPLLVDAGHETIVASRSGDVAVDITTGEGLAGAVDDVDVVVHLASNARKPQETDVAGTRRLLDALADQHLVYVSIVGVDRHPFLYYRAKLEAEEMIRESGRPFTILRATQFHAFLDYLLSLICRRRLALVPSGFVFQPISVNEVAHEVARLVQDRPGGLQPDHAGPEILGIEHTARTYMEARGREAPLAKFPVPGQTGKAFRDGVHTNPDRAVGTMTWPEYLAVRFPPWNV